jgi:BMFP domain-containing protein YqiC
MGSGSSELQGLLRIVVNLQESASALMKRVKALESGQASAKRALAAALDDLARRVGELEAEAAIKPPPSRANRRKAGKKAGN